MTAEAKTPTTYDDPAVVATVRAVRDVRGRVPLVELVTDKLLLRAPVDACEMLCRGLARVAMGGESDDDGNCLVFSKYHRVWQLASVEDAERGYVEGVYSYDLTDEAERARDEEEKAAIAAREEMNR